ncbi:BEN domain-containing protein 5 [Acipenser ruthenus]|uniref:BEN domain-containing protein 5 n=1 Tax=Acipenser ruthenus TaxID=7906 RepID=A0A444UL19_ACIRT|nr:BEN domain-containing protein 5 [Acipenser ruthenus]
MSAIMSQSGEEGVNDHVKDGKLSIVKWRKWENSKTKASAKQQRSTEILNQLTKKPQTNKEDGEVQQLKSKIQELEQENKKLKEMVVGAIPVILDKIEELGKRDNSGPTDHSIDSEANCLCGSPRYAASSAGSTVSISSIPQSQGNGRQLDKVEIHPGSGVYIDQLAWTITNKATSYTSFVRNAMLSVFDIETLVKSNLRGGSGKRQKHGERREALDPNKVNAIYELAKVKVREYLLELSSRQLRLNLSPG